MNLENYYKNNKRNNYKKRIKHGDKIYKSQSEACKQLQISTPTIKRYLNKGIYEGKKIKYMNNYDKQKYENNKSINDLNEYDKNKVIDNVLKVIKKYKKYKIDDFNEEYETDDDKYDDIKQENETDDETDDEIEQENETDDETEQENETDDETEQENETDEQENEMDNKKFGIYLIDYFNRDETKQDLIDYIFDEYKSNYNGEDWDNFIENKENEYNLIGG